MNFLRDAMAAVQRNATALLIYTVAVLANHAAIAAAEIYVTGGRLVDPGALTLSDHVIYLVAQLITAPIVAAGSAVAFARMGKEMDRPLWRSANDRDALRRFFQLWFTLTLLGMALVQISMLAASAELDALALLLYLFSLLFFLVTIPVGGCIMFAGNLHWRDLGSVLAPLGHNLLRTFGLIFINFFQFWLVINVEELRRNGDGLQWVWVVPVVAIICAYLDCLVFAGTWILCIEHRNADEDVDFDF